MHGHTDGRTDGQRLRGGINRVDPDQTALGPNCMSKRLLKHFSRQEKQTTLVAIGALRVNNSCRQKQLQITILKYIFCNFIEEKVCFSYFSTK